MPLLSCRLAVAALMMTSLSRRRIGSTASAWVERSCCHFWAHIHDWTFWCSRSKAVRAGVLRPQSLKAESSSSSFIGCGFSGLGVDCRRGSVRGCLSDLPGMDPCLALGFQRRQVRVRFPSRG